MGGLFSQPTPKKQKPVVSIPIPLLMARAQYIGQPLANVLSALRTRGIENIVVAIKSREIWVPPARKHTGRIYVLYNADSLLVQDVVYE